MVRWGVLGSAQIAKACVIPAILKAENGTLQAIASRSLAKAKHLVQEYQQGIPFGDYTALVESSEIDAVYIPLPNHLHHEWTIKALSAGKHVLVEKPFAMNTPQAVEMVQAAQRNKCLLMEAFMYRFHPRSIRIKELVDSGALGQISLLHSAFTFPVRRDGSNERLFLPEMGGGSLWDVGCYGVSVARWLLAAEPVDVVAQASYSQSGVDVNFVGTLSFVSGALAVIESSFTAALQQTFTVVGTKGAIELPHDAFVPWEKEAWFSIRDAQEEQGQRVTLPASDEYQQMIEHFSQVVMGKCTQAFPPEESINQMRVLDALAQSARTGVKIKL